MNKMELSTLIKGYRKPAFTLAEVLITLGIIGVVAAMTLPALIQDHAKKVVEARLKKFYSSINQAILMAENDYGDKKIWYEDVTGAQFDGEGNPIEGSSDAEKWVNKYLKPYLNVTKVETLGNNAPPAIKGAVMIYFADGTALSFWQKSTRDWFFFTGNINKCLKNKNVLNLNDVTGKCVFSFTFNPGNGTSSWKYHYNKGFEPYKVSWDGDINKLYDGSTYACNGSNNNARHYCTAIIQMNNWTIPDDYPFKVSY